MRRESADVIDPQFDVPQVDTDSLLADAKALAGKNVSWRDDTEQTSIAPPLMISQFLAETQKDRVWDNEAVTPLADNAPGDPDWDFEAEPTQALDMHRLAPWYVPEAPDLPVADSSRPRIEPALKDLVEPVDGSKPFRVGRDSEREDISHTAPLRPRHLLDEESSTPRTRRPSGVREILKGLPEAEPKSRSPKPISRAALAAAAMRAARAARRGREDIWGPFEDPSQPSAADDLDDAQTEIALPGKATIPARGRAAGGLTLADVESHLAAVAAPGASAPPPLPLTAAHGPMLAPPARAERSPRRVEPRTWAGLAGGILAFAVLLLLLSTRSQPGPATQVEPAKEPHAAPAAAPAAPARTVDSGFIVTTEPPGASVYVDGQPTGLVTPARVRGLTPGLHAAEFKLAGHYDTSIPVVLKPGAIAKLGGVALRPLTAAEEPAAVAEPAAPAPAAAAAAAAAKAAEPEVAEAAPAPEPPEQAEATTAERSASERTQAERPRRRAAPAEARGEGVLQITSRPWARVFVDDQFVGNTPQRELRLPAGLHVVRLVNEPMNMSKTVAVEINDGETLTKVVRLNISPEEP